MNRLEEEYSCHLQNQFKFGLILDWKFESIKLRLAERTFYETDFIVVTQNQIEIHEVKGHWEDDARVKIKCAAEIYWWFAFYGIKKERGVWSREYFNHENKNRIGE